MGHPNAVLVRRWFEEIWNERRESTIDELLTAESICYLDEGPMIGPEAFKKQQYEPFVAAFSDLRVEIEGIVTEGDHAVVRWSASATHDGDGLGFQATHTPVNFQGMTWVEIRDGKFVQGWQNSNISGKLAQLAAAVST